MKSFITIFVFGFVAAFIVPAASFAQITGDVSGTVQDSTGGAVPNAKVTLTSKETKALRTQQSDEDGRFAFNLLQIGEYEVKAESAAFQTFVTTAFVRSGETASVRFSLQVGQVNETVVVNDAVSPLDNANAQLQVSVVGENVQNLPVNRSPNLFAQLAPGVIPTTLNNSFLGSGSFNVNGSRGRANNITVDNITATDISVTGTGGALGPLSLTQVKEVKLITNTFSAEFGRNSGSQLQYITKSGSNEFHGEFFEYFQNDKLNARSFFDRTGKANIVRFNDYGLATGGPIKKDKLFFFGTVEWVKSRGAGSTVIAQVPTPAMIASVTDPTSKKLLDQYKLPAAQTETSTAGTVEQSAGTLGNSRQWSVRGDWNISDKGRLALKYADFQSDSSGSSNTFVGTNLANFGTRSVNHPRMANANFSYVVSPTLVNDFNFGHGRHAPDFPFETTVPLGPRITFSNAQVSSFGQWEGLPQGRSQDSYQVLNTLSWLKNGHSLKAGIDLFFYKSESIADSSSRGNFTFANWADFAIGAPSNAVQRFGSSLRKYTTNNQFVFAQDDWRIRPNLTLNLGIRVERAGGVSEDNGLLTRLNLDCRSSIGAAGSGPLGCLEFGGSQFDPSWNYAPRIGFAWNPFGDQKTVLRGGYGIAYDFIYLNLVTNGRYLVPFITTAQIAGLTSFVGENSYANFVAGTSAAQRTAVANIGVINQTATNLGAINPAFQGNLRNPQTHSWSMEVQRDIQGLVAKVRYVGTKTNYLQKTRSLNPITGVAPATSLADEEARLVQLRAANAGGTAQSTSRSNRIDPRFNDVLYVDSSGNSNYHALQAELVKRMGTYFLQASYTYSKSIDDASDALAVLLNDAALQQNPYNNRDNRAPSQFDIRHRIVVAHDWQPQWGRSSSNGFIRYGLAGWGFSGISSYRTGFPVTFDSGGRLQVTPSSIIGSTAAPVRPNVSGAFEFNPRPAGSADAPSGLTGAIPISAYAASLGLSQPLLGNFGNLGRNTHRINGAPSFDLTAYKNFAITERAKFQFRAEFYNAFNNVVFQEVNRNISNTNFGQYTRTAFEPRQIQLAGRITF